MSHRSRQVAGKNAFAAGKEFEVKCVGARLKADHQAGILRHLTHSQPTFRRVGKEFFPVAQGGADWVGILSGSSMSVAVESKSTKKGFFAYEQIPDGELEHLDAVASSRGISLLAIEFRDEEEFASVFISPPQRFLVPWEQVPWKIARKNKRITPELLVGWEMPSTGNSLLVDFIRRCPTCRSVFPVGSKILCRCFTVGEV